MNRKERNKMDILSGSDIHRIVKKAMMEKGYSDKDVPLSMVKDIFDCYSELIYTCLLNGIRVMLPNIGEFYRDIKSGRKAGYYRVPSCRDTHEPFSKDTVWHTEYMEQAPAFGKIVFVEFPRVKKKFRADTTGKV